MISFDQVMVKLAAVEDVLNLGYYREKVEEELDKRVNGLRGIFKKRRILSEIKSIKFDDNSIKEDDIKNFLVKVEEIFDKNGIDSSNIEYIREDLLNHSKTIRNLNINQWVGFFRYILYHLVDDVIDEFEKNEKIKMEHTHRYLDNLINAYKSDFSKSVLNRGFLEHFGIFKGITGQFSKGHLADYVIRNSVNIKRMLKDPSVELNQRNKDKFTQYLDTIGFVWDLRTGSEIDRSAIEKLSFLGENFLTYVEADYRMASKGVGSKESVTEIPKYILLRQISVKLKKLPPTDMSVRTMLNSINLSSFKESIIEEFHINKFNAFAKKSGVSLHDILSPVGEGTTRLVAMMIAATKSNELDKETRVLFDKVLYEIKSVNSAYNRYVRLISDEDVENDDKALSHCLSSIREALRVIGHGQEPPPPPRNPPPPPPRNPSDEEQKEKTEGEKFLDRLMNDPSKIRPKDDQPGGKRKEKKKVREDDDD